MAKKKTKRGTVELEQPPGSEGESQEELLSRMVTNSAFQSALTLSKFADDVGQLNLSKSLKLASHNAAQASNGKLQSLEQMLAAQASTLDVLFNAMARRAANNLGHYPETVERYLKLGLRAQAQCRTTISALAEIKNPKAVYISGQANISNGPQQVNNHAHGTETNNQPNKQSEGQAYELHQNARTQSLESRTNPALEAVGAIDRAEVGTG